MSARKATIFTDSRLLERILKQDGLGRSLANLHSYAGRLFIALQEIGFVQPEYVHPPGGMIMPSVEKYFDRYDSDYATVAEANRSCKRIEAQRREITDTNFRTVELAVRWYKPDRQDPALTLVFALYFDTMVTTRLSMAEIGAP